MFHPLRSTVPAVCENETALRPRLLRRNVPVPECRIAGLVADRFGSKSCREPLLNSRARLPAVMAEKVLRLTEAEAVVKVEEPKLRLPLPESAPMEWARPLPRDMVPPDTISAPVISPLDWSVVVPAPLRKIVGKAAPGLGVKFCDPTKHSTPVPAFMDAAREKSAVLQTVRVSLVNNSVPIYPPVNAIVAALPCTSSVQFLLEVLLKRTRAAESGTISPDQFAAVLHLPSVPPPSQMRYTTGLTFSAPSAMTCEAGFSTAQESLIQSSDLATLAMRTSSMYPFQQVAPPHASPLPISHQPVLPELLP